MARINIEDGLLKDQRFIDLMIELKGLEAALGAVVHCWMIAQEYWKHSDHGIPKVEWKKQKLCDALISCGMAEDRGDFVFVIGSSKHFAWIRQKVSAGHNGGVKSGKGTIENKGKNSKRKQAGVSADKRSEPSLSTSSSPSSSSISSSSKYMYSVGNGADAPPLENGIKNPVGFFISNYVNAYQGRYGVKARPSLSGKTQGQIRRFVEETALERACNLIQRYCEMSDAWFLTKAHDFGTFIENLTKVGLALDTGQTSTATQARMAEKTSHAEGQLSRIAKGEL